MDQLPGRNCAAVLMAMDLPFHTMVRCLMDELDLTNDEAETALFAATPKAVADTRLRAVAPALRGRPPRHGLSAAPKLIKSVGLPPRNRLVRSAGHR